MGNKHIRINTKGEDAAVRMADKSPPFSEEMKRDSAIRFESRKFTQNDIRGPDYQTASKSASVNASTTKAPAGGKGAGVSKPRTTANGKSTRAGNFKPKAQAGGGKSHGNKQGKAGQATSRAAKAKAATATRSKYLKGLKGTGRTVNSALNEFNEEVRGERKDNLGLRTVDESVGGMIRTKKAITGTVRTAKTTARVVKKTANTAWKVGKKTVQVAKKAGELAVKVVQKVAAAVGKLITAIAANPIVLVVIAGILVLILLIYMLVSAFQGTPKNLMGEEMYTAIQTYLREQDRAVQREFEEYEDRPDFSDIAEEDVTKVTEVYPSTSMKLISSYLMAKHENALTLEKAKREIDAIHIQLYRIEQEITTEEYEAEEPVLNEQGQQVMNADGTPMTETVTKTKRLLTVTLTGQTLKQFFDENLDTMLTKSQKSSYDWFVYISGLSGSGEFGPPFEDENYLSRVTQEFGVPGALDGKPHRGMDFAYPAGTPIQNIMSGKVVEVSNHWSWGLTVVVQSDDSTYRVRYAHMSAIYVGVGETVAVGDVVGLVGSTGVSSGNHLHLEVEENGQLINPRDVLPD